MNKLTNKRVYYERCDPNFVDKMYQTFSLFRKRITSLYQIKRYEYANSAIPKINEPVILDIGCGFGFGMEILDQRGEIIGLDVSCDSIYHSMKNYRHPHISYLIGDAHFLPFRNSIFKGICCLEVIEHVKYPGKVIEEIRRVLSGLCIFSTPVARSIQTNKDPFHIKEYTLKEFRSLLIKHRFNIKNTYGLLLVGSCFLIGTLEKVFFFKKIFNMKTLFKQFHRLAQLFVVLPRNIPALGAFMIVIATRRSRDREGRGCRNDVQRLQ